MRIICLAVSINHDAENAATAIARAHHSEADLRMQMQDRYEGITAAAATGCAHIYGGPASTNRLAFNVHRDQSQYLKAKPGDSGGLDLVTGLPWRMDKLGYRRFYLGHNSLNRGAQTT